MELNLKLNIKFCSCNWFLKKVQLFIKLTRRTCFNYYNTYLILKLYIYTKHLVLNKEQTKKAKFHLLLRKTNFFLEFHQTTNASTNSCAKRKTAERTVYRRIIRNPKKAWNDFAPKTANTETFLILYIQLIQLFVNRHLGKWVWY